MSRREVRTRSILIYISMLMPSVLIYISIQQRSPDEQAGIAYARMLEQGRALAETLQACTLRPLTTSTVSPHTTST
jgi:hypothetical protein